MENPDSTCWTMIQGAAAGRKEDRDEFARRYLPVIHAYLKARWRSSPHREEIDDAIQEVFVECFRRGGVLDRVDPNRAGGFRAFFYGVVRNVARKIEAGRGSGRDEEPPLGFEADGLQGSDESFSRVFDRAWARSIVKQARDRMSRRAKEAGEAAQKRVELLRLRFYEGIPIREIARKWNADAAALHHEYARARAEYRETLAEVVAFHHPGSPEEIARECANLLGILKRG